MIYPDFPELTQLQALLGELELHAHIEVVEHITFQELTFPIHCISIGSTAPDAPVIAYFGGVHGLEKIGTEVLLAYLQTLLQLLSWDGEWISRLQRMRLIFMPIVNPVGVYRGSRCNGNGVDLMRNAPIEGSGKTKLYSGHRISSALPWYRGNESGMEPEAQALCKMVREQLAQSPLVIAVDLHSGFGLQDRLWFPYAGRQQPFAALAEAHALKQLFDRSYPNHFYTIEPMSQEYVINGDLWDYLFDEHLTNTQTDTVFMPLTLEMGSWSWLRKSPLHLFSRHGLFHPLLPHRQQRILRRHLTLFDFLSRAALYPQHWAYLSESERMHHLQQAMRTWYE
jgi:hypothetical protein